MKAEIHWNCFKDIYSAVLHSLSNPTYWKWCNCKQELKHTSVNTRRKLGITDIYKLTTKVKRTAYAVLHLLHAEGPQSTPSPHVWKLSWLTWNRLMNNSIFLHQCITLTGNLASKRFHCGQQFNMPHILIINYITAKMLLPGLSCTNAESTLNIFKGRFTHLSFPIPLILQPKAVGMLCFGSLTNFTYLLSLWVFWLWTLLCSAPNQSSYCCFSNLHVNIS